MGGGSTKKNARKGKEMGRLTVIKIGEKGVGEIFHSVPSKSQMEQPVGIYEDFDWTVIFPYINYGVSYVCRAPSYP